MRIFGVQVVARPVVITAQELRVSASLRPITTVLALTLNLIAHPISDTVACCSVLKLLAGAKARVSATGIRNYEYVLEAAADFTKLVCSRRSNRPSDQVQRWLHL